MSDMEEMKRTLEVLQKELAELRKGKESTDEEDEQPLRQIMYVPKERKLKKFGGHPKTDSDQTAEEFIDDARSAIASMRSKDQIDFLLSHLEGAAKSEVRLRKECKNAETIFSVLAECFGDNRSGPQLLRQFYDRKQKEGESLRVFSHALMEILDKIMSRDEKGQKVHISDRNVVLRDQFAENVRDAPLRRELKRRLRDEPDITFLELRAEAIKWSEEDDKVMAARKTVSSRQITVDSDSAESSAIECLAESASLDKVAKTVETQQKMLDDLTSMVKTWMSHKAPSVEASDGRQQGNVKCFYCKRQGHVIRECRIRKRKEQKLQSPSTGTRVSAQANPSEN